MENSMKEQADFCFVINARYIGRFMVTFSSLMENFTMMCRVHLLYSGLNEEQKDDMRKFVERLGGSIAFYEIDSSIFKGLPKLRDDETYSAYNKILIPYYLSHLGKVLYLDCDIIIRGDIKELFYLETGTFLSCVPDIRINKTQREHIGRIIEGDYLYFNSGVILFDFKYKDKIVPRQELFDYVKENSAVIRWHDQDILNHFYAGNCYLLEEKYNYLTAYKSIKDIFFHRECKKAVVLHYANWKPWDENYIGKAYSEYRKAYERIAGEKYINFLQKRRFWVQIKLIAKYVFR